MGASSRVRSLLVVLLVACTGLVVSLQGWKSRTPTFDLVPHILDASALVSEGKIPMKGTLSSLVAYTPPGITWLLAPGLLMTNDPRLFEFVGTAILYGGTLLGVFLVAEASFGAGTAVLAAALYGLSGVGLFFAASLWPRGHPFFYVWMVYWLRRWVVDNEPRALAVGVAIWSVGMYVFMEIAPAVLLVPVLWYLFRPPVRFVPLLVALVVSLGVWSPYLVYERTRDFRDLRAQLARTPLHTSGTPANYREAWCNPAAQLENDGSASAGAEGDVVGSTVVPERGLRSRVADAGYQGVAKWHALVGNAVHGMVGGGSAPGSDVRGITLLLGSLASVVALVLTWPAPRARMMSSEPVTQPAACTALGAAFAVIGLSAGLILPRLLSPDGFLEPATREALFWLQIDIIFVALILLSAKHIRLAFRRLAERMSTEIDPRRSAPYFVAVALAVPWVGLLLVAEPGRFERFWWLWPLHSIVLAALSTDTFKRLAWPSAIRWSAAALIFAFVCGTASGAARLKSWARDGWAGADSDQMRAVEYIAGQLHGRQEARIGYQVPFQKFMATLHADDSRYKVGAEFDVLFRYRHGLKNADQCAEGLSFDDQYRMVQAAAVESLTLKHHFNVPSDSTFTPVYEAGLFRVVRRN
jgi:hypothetical protein